MNARQAVRALSLLLGLAFASGMGWAPARAGSPASAASANPSAPAAASRWVKTELYCGGRLANGSLISPEAWQAFLAEVITPAFPDGLTVLQARGQMKDSSGTIRRQPTWVVVIVHPTGAASEQRLQAVIAGFRSRFRGAELMRVDIAAAPPQFFAN